MSLSMEELRTPSEREMLRLPDDVVGSLGYQLNRVEEIRRIEAEFRRSQEEAHDS